MKIREAMDVAEVQNLREILGPCIIEHELHTLTESTVNLCFKRLSEGIETFNLKESGMAAADFMLMRLFFNGQSNVVAFKHRGTRNYVYWLDAKGVLVIPIIPDTHFQRGEFFLYVTVPEEGDDSHE